MRQLPQIAPEAAGNSDNSDNSVLSDLWDIVRQRDERDDLRDLLMRDVLYIPPQMRHILQIAVKRARCANDHLWANRVQIALNESMDHYGLNRPELDNSGKTDFSVIADFLTQITQ